MLNDIDLRGMPTPAASFEKTAWLGPLLRRYGPSAWVRPVGRFLDRGIREAGRDLITDPVRRNKIMPYLSGIGQQAASDAVWGGIIGGTFEGGIGALQAEPGERGEAFARGALSGLVPNVALGALSGAASRVVHNTGRQRMRALAEQHGMEAQRGQVKKMMREPGFFKNLNYAFTDKGLRGQLARTRALTGLGTFGTGFVLPAMLTPSASAATPPPPPPTPQFQPNAPAVYEQPQYYKTSAAKALKSIDFNQMPRYHP